MSASRPETEVAERSELRAAVEAELARESGSSRFPHILRERYEADRAIARARELRRLGAAAAMLYPAITLFMHFVVMRRQPAGVALIQVLVFVPNIVLALRLWARPGLSAFWREAMSLGLCCLIVACGILNAALAPPDLVPMDMFFLVTPVIGCMFFTRMPPNMALAFVGFSLLAVATLSWVRRDVPGVGAYPFGALATSSALALMALRELDSAMRRLYLMSLRQDLRLEELTAENSSLDRLCATDPLTGAGNRRHFEKSLVALGAAAGRHFLLFIDVDNFKQLNDRHGHIVGDACLRQAVATISACLHPSDTLARLGGDEFAVVMSNRPRLDAWRTAEQICARLAEHAFDIDGKPHHISVTIGAAEWDASLGRAGLLEAADAALYQAKRAGRGRVAWAPPPNAGTAAA